MRIPFQKLKAIQEIPFVFWNSKVWTMFEVAFSQIIQTTH